MQVRFQNEVRLPVKPPKSASDPSDALDSKPVPSSADAEAFMGLLETHKKIIFKIARLYTENVADRQDLTQDMIMTLWQSQDSFAGNSKWSTWMYRVCLNVALSWKRSKRRYDAKHTELDAALIEWVPAPHNERQEKFELLQQLLHHLAEMDRALILLHMEGQDYDEIAAIMNLSASNVSTRLSRIKQKLQDQLSGKTSLQSIGNSSINHSSKMDASPKESFT